MTIEEIKEKYFYFLTDTTLMGRELEFDEIKEIVSVSNEHENEWKKEFQDLQIQRMNDAKDIEAYADALAKYKISCINYESYYCLAKVIGNDLLNKKFDSEYIFPHFYSLFASERCGALHKKYFKEDGLFEYVNINKPNEFDGLISLINKVIDIDTYNSNYKKLIMQLLKEYK